MCVSRCAGLQVSVTRRLAEGQHTDPSCNALHAVLCCAMQVRRMLNERRDAKWSFNTLYLYKDSFAIMLEGACMWCVGQGWSVGGWVGGCWL